MYTIACHQIIQTIQLISDKVTRKVTVVLIKMPYQIYRRYAETWTFSLNV